MSLPFGDDDGCLHYWWKTVPRRDLRTECNVQQVVFWAPQWQKHYKFPFHHQQQQLQQLLLSSTQIPAHCNHTMTNLNNTTILYYHSNSITKVLPMERLRSFRESFRRRKRDKVSEPSNVHQWHTDEICVRQGNCTFPIKYLGCVEVFESRGMPICEEALKVLRGTKRKAIRGTLFVTGDGLRVVDGETRGLIVDQTIEKVSFCAPDRSNERGFAYICRDGTTRRWMCHGFHAIGTTGERISHAVGYAFAICLERKQKRDREAAELAAAAAAMSNNHHHRNHHRDNHTSFKLNEPPPMKPVINPFAIDRPHATPLMLQRQTSFRPLSNLRSQSPFKRQLSLKLIGTQANK